MLDGGYRRREIDMCATVNCQHALVLRLEQQTWHEHLHDESDRARRSAVS